MDKYVLEPLNGYLILAEKTFKNPKKYSTSWNFGSEKIQLLLFLRL